jgi:hypothetical protein
MSDGRMRRELLVLQWVLGVVIFAEAAVFAFSPSAAAGFARTVLPNFVRLALAWGEMAAAVIFLVPRSTRFGGWLLLVVLAFAVVLHLLHGWLDVGGLAVYAAATWAVIAAKTQQETAGQS